MQQFLKLCLCLVRPCAGKRTCEVLGERLAGCSEL